MQIRSLFSASLAVGAFVSALQLPATSGPYTLGTVSLELVDRSRTDPLAPTPQTSRDLMVSLIYPSDASNCENASFSRVFSPQIAPYFDNYYSVPNGTAASIISRSHLNAPLVDNDLPILIFGHGFGGSRSMYTSQLEDLASHGWIIVAVDTTYEAVGVEFPGGRLLSSNVPANATLEYAELVLKTRVEDAKFVLDSLKDPNTLERIPGLAKTGKKLHADTAAIFGHSFGGATAAQAMAEYSSFTCGVNIDGSILGSVTETGLEGPFVQVASQIHNRSNDATWAQFWENLNGFKREFNVNGTVHESFEDVIIYRDVFGTKFPMEEGDLWGSITGDRLVQIETGLMNSFFGFCLKGQDASELDRLAEEKFPEVSVFP